MQNKTFFVLLIVTLLTPVRGFMPSFNMALRLFFSLRLCLVLSLPPVIDGKSLNTHYHWYHRLLSSWFGMSIKYMIQLGNGPKHAQQSNCSVAIERANLYAIELVHKMKQIKKKWLASIQTCLLVLSLRRRLHLAVRAVYPKFTLVGLIFRQLVNSQIQNVGQYYPYFRSCLPTRISQHSKLNYKSLPSPISSYNNDYNKVDELLLGN